jgi:ribonuclease P protein component
VLPARHRLRTAADFAAAVRGSGGARSGGRLLVVHGRFTGRYASAPGLEGRLAPPRAGFVVSKAVGGAVTRNRTRRVLRHLVATRLTRIPDGCDLVVRANPAAASASTPELAAELDRSLDRVLRRLETVSHTRAAVPS